MNVRLKVLGGGKSVTGSKYLLEIGDFKLLVDCGLFQGVKELRRRNWDNFPVDPKDINAVVLTHAHLDHTGYLPRLFKEGYNGPVYCTEATADLAELLLLDSAKLMEEEANFARKKGYSRHENPEPLYTQDDVKKVIPKLKSYFFHKEFKINHNITVKFSYAGHILGAAIVEIVIQGDTQTKKIVFSGDLGREQDPILEEPELIRSADVVFVESTYGSRKIRNESPIEEIADIINTTFDSGGCVVIPAFAVGRTQNLLYVLKELLDKKMIPDVPIFMDSPMAIRATVLYRKYQHYHKLSEDFVESDNSFLSLSRNLNIIQSHQGSVELNTIREGAIIISASGMMTGGRILHHLYHRLPRENDTLMIVGYQAEGTRGRRLYDGELFIRIFGQFVPVNARVEHIDRLSAHADQDGLMHWLRGFQQKPKMSFVIHGEEGGANVLADLMREEFGWNVNVPGYLSTYILFDGI